ncbi:MAG: Gfo/Idh/MocA family protein [Chthoniobacterales bacterium]
MSALNEIQAVDRRSFLTRAGRGLLAASLTPAMLQLAAAADPLGRGNSPQPVTAAGGEPLPQDQRIGFALVGLGRLTMGQLIPAFRTSKRAKLVALVSGDSGKAHKVAQENGVKSEAVYDYKTFDRIRDNADVRVVYNVLPNSMHAEYTIRAAQAGKHVLCEKPMETSSAKCQQMIDACNKANVKLMIAYRIQYEPMNRAIHKMVRDQTFGPVKLIESANSQMVEKMEWRLNKELSGSGAVGDVGVYCINTIRFLLGEEPIEVFARATQPLNDPRFKEVAASTAWQMRFPSGVLANCSCSFDAHDTKEYRIIADRGTFGMNPAFPYRGLKMFSQPNDPPLPPIPESDQFANEMDHMADCVLHNRQPYTPGEEGLQDQRIIEAILESAGCDKSVALPRVDKIDAFRGSVPT